MERVAAEQSSAFDDIGNGIFPPDYGAVDGRKIRKGNALAEMLSRSKRFIHTR